MSFPIEVVATVNLGDVSIQKVVTLNRPISALLGPNGSGKTHLLRALKNGFGPHAGGKRVRFVSAGRMGMLEQYRSDYDGNRGGQPRYERAAFGDKSAAERRHAMESIAGDFQTIAERPDILIKIQERLRKLFRRDLFIDWDGGSLKASFSRIGPKVKAYSSGREASGLMHMVGILAALYDDDVGVLLLDEPEVSLHPQLQAFLQREMITVAGIPDIGSNKKLIVIATHSTEMVQLHTPEDLTALVFCYDVERPLVQVSKDAGELQSKQIINLVSRLGQEHKLALFCGRPLLVEGPSDSIICNALSAKLNLYLEAAGSQLLPVIGKGQMATVCKLMRLMGKNPTVLVDADGVADGLELVNFYLSGNADADLAASANGFPTASKMAGSIFSDFCKMVDDRWSEISALASTRTYWTNKGGAPDNLRQRRSTLCALLCEPEDVLTAISEDLAWGKLARRLSSLLALCEQFGLFVLRRGTIEAYYVKADPYSSVGKPEAATEEAIHISAISEEETRAAYEDVVRCIRYAAQAESINEADALRDLVLAAVAPAHGRLRIGDTSLDFNVLARQTIGDKSKIMDLTLEKDMLKVSLTSKIIDAPGFPVYIAKDQDPIQVIAQAVTKPA